MSTHSTRSPSKRDRWSRCPASVREELKYPDDRSGPAAIDGTHTHTLLSHVIENNLTNASSLVGATLKDDDGEFVVDDSRAERVQVALKYIDERFDTLEPDVKVFSEVKVDLSPVFGRTDMNGTADIVIISEHLIEVIDYKDGMSYVEVVGNKQLNTYLWGVIAQIGIDSLTQKEVRLTIIQPKMRTKGSAGVYYDNMSMNTFLATKDTLAQEIAATDDPNAAFVPGEIQCKYCKHKGACTAATQVGMASMGVDLTNLNVVQDVVDKEPSTMSDQQIREIIEAAPLIRQLLEATEKEAMSRINSGKNIAGLKLVRGRGSRSWVYDTELMETKLIKLGIPKGEVYETKLITPAKAEKLTWKKRDGTVKQLSDRQLKVLHDEYITKSDGALQVVSEADTRPAVVTDVSSMFQPIVTAAPLPDFLQAPAWLV